SRTVRPLADGAAHVISLARRSPASCRSVKRTSRSSRTGIGHLDLLAHGEVAGDLGQSGGVVEQLRVHRYVPALTPVHHDHLVLAAWHGDECHGRHREDVLVLRRGYLDLNLGLVEEALDGAGDRDRDGCGGGVARPGAARATGVTGATGGVTGVTG